MGAIILEMCIATEKKSLAESNILRWDGMKDYL